MQQKTHTMYAYCESPNITIKNQFSDERILLLVRKHPLTQVSWILNSIFLLFCTIAITYISPFFQITSQIQILLYTVLLTCTLLYVVVQVTHWYFNVGVITNKRVSDIDTYIHLKQEVSQTLLHKVSEVSSKQSGIFRSLYNYGDVFFKTEGTTVVTIEFLCVPNPSDVVQLINNYIQHRPHA